MSGTVTAVGSDTLTVTLVNSGGVGGTLTVSLGTHRHWPRPARGGVQRHPDRPQYLPAHPRHGQTRPGRPAARPARPPAARPAPPPRHVRLRHVRGAAASGTSASGTSGAAAGATSGPANTAVKLSLGIFSWTGSPPATGQAFDVSGTVTQVGSDTVTITLAPGDVSGTVTIGSVCIPPARRPGASAHLSGTRTGSDTYQVTQFSLSQSASDNVPAAIGTSNADPAPGALRVETSTTPGR